MRVPRRNLFVVLGAAGLLLFSTLGYVASAIFRSDNLPTFEGAMGQFSPSRESPPAPLTPILDTKGATMNLSDFRGKVVLLNFWATWCAPCVREMPALDRLQAEMGSDEFIVLALSIDRGGLKTVVPFFKQLNLRSLSVFLDSQGKALKPFGVRGMPTSFIIDHRGRIAGKLEGPAEWDTDEAKALMRYYIERIGDKTDGAYPVDFGTDKDAVNGPAVQPLSTVVTNESVGNLG